jgi:hypothetical protein
MAGGTELWIRRLTLSVGGKKLDLTNMQAQFVVRLKDSPNPNWCYVKVTNLAEQNATELFSKGAGAAIELEAGYKSRIGPIFKGTASQMRKGKEDNGTDTYFDVMAVANTPAWGYSFVNKTLKAGHTFKDIVDEVLKPMKEKGVEIGFIAELGKRKFPRASVLLGHPRDILNDVAYSTNTSWSIQNEKFQMVKNNGNVGGEVPVLNGRTGLIGIPEQTLKGIKVVCLLDSGMRVRGQVKIDTKNINEAQVGLPPTEGTVGSTDAARRAMIPQVATDGIYDIVRVDHDGEMEGKPWYTTLHCVGSKDQSPAAQGLRAGANAALDTGQNLDTGTERGVQEMDLLTDEDFGAPGETVKGGPV